ncbi:hypothetical protein EAE96_009469 [Botrytis aclada]|nr:hypothetical protein EAE96_009469 [Botrytis aclada]
MDELIPTEPGGLIQWAEPDVTSMRITKTNSSNTETALHRLFTLTAAQDPRLIPQWPSQLPELLADQGMKQVYAHHVNAKPRASSGVRDARVQSTHL